MTRFLTRGIASKVNLPKLDLVELKDTIEAKIDSVREYPGSRKGDPGIWRLPDWLMYQVERKMEGKKGKEVF